MEPVVKERTCPSCGSTVEPVRILYRDPVPDMAERAARGEVVLGGCVVTGDDPEWACPAYRDPVAIRVAVQPGTEGSPQGR